MGGGTFCHGGSRLYLFLRGEHFERIDVLKVLQPTGTKLGALPMGNGPVHVPKEWAGQSAALFEHTDHSALSG
jgi:hypothetical protein